MPKVLSFVEARPQFVKEAMIYRAVQRLSPWNHVLVHSGQHYGIVMSRYVDEDLLDGDGHAAERIVEIIKFNL